MTNTLTLSAAIAGLLGVLTPPLTAVVQQPKWTPRTRSIVALIVAAVLGTAATIAQGVFRVGVGADGRVDWASLIATITAVYVASQAAYQALWKPTGVAPAVEVRTSPGFRMPDTVEAADYVPPEHRNLRGTPPDKRHRAR